MDVKQETAGSLFWTERFEAFRLAKLLHCAVVSEEGLGPKAGVKEWREMRQWAQDFAETCDAIIEDCIERGDPRMGGK